jgi:tetratricopeptide (TPR) repeat protein
VDGYYWRAGVYYDLEKYPEALSDYNRAISIKNDRAEIYDARAATYNKLGKFQDEINDLNQVIKLTPNEADAYKFRGDAYQALAEQTKNKKQKAEYLKKAEEDFVMMEKLGGSR